MKKASLLARCIIVVCLSVMAGHANAQTSPSEPVVYGAPISLESALDLVEATRVESQARGLRMAIAVVEPSGELVAFARMDGVPYATVRFSQQKARSAARFRIPTSLFEDRVTGGDVKLLTSDEVIAVGGGVPIFENGRVIGALGVSGAAAAVDAELASTIVERRSFSN